MVETMTRVSPLGDWAAKFAAAPPLVTVREIPFLSQVCLRVDLSGDGGRVGELVAGVLGVGLPELPCTSARSDRCEVLWLGPDEWLILGPDGAAEQLVTDLRAALAGVAAHHAVTDTSAQRTAVSLSGVGARRLLAKGCSVDLHPRVRANGSCVQTLVAQAGVVIVVHDDAASDFLLLVRSSFAGYLAAWVLDAAIDL
jgi:sarcosine oxidase subunit gamma